MSEPLELWAKAPASLITDRAISDTALRVYLYLDLRAGKRGYWYGTQQELADALGAGKRTVTRAVASIRKLGLVETARAGRDKGVLLYRIEARDAPSMATLLKPEWPSVTPRDAIRGHSAKTHPINHRSSPRSIKSTLTPKTDWDEHRKRMDEKIRGLGLQGDQIKEAVGEYRTA